MSLPRARDDQPTLPCQETKVVQGPGHLPEGTPNLQHALEAGSTAEAERLYKQTPAHSGYAYDMLNRQLARHNHLCIF